MAYDGSLMVDFIQGTHATEDLTEREKHLIGLAVTMTRGCLMCTTSRIKSAREAGISEETLNAMTGIAAAVNAGVTARTAATGFEGADEQMAAACADGTCEVPAAVEA